MIKDFTAEMSTLHGTAGDYSIKFPKNISDNDAEIKIICRGDQWPSTEIFVDRDDCVISVMGMLEFNAFVRFMCEYGASTGVCEIIHTRSEREVNLQNQFLAGPAATLPAPYTCTCGSTSSRLQREMFGDEMERVCNDCNRSEADAKFILKKEMEMPFGKHKGTSLVDLIKNEPDYVEWLLKTIAPGNLSRRLDELWSSRDE